MKLQFQGVNSALNTAVSPLNGLQNKLTNQNLNTPIIDTVKFSSFEEIQQLRIENTKLFFKRMEEKRATSMGLDLVLKDIEEELGINSVNELRQKYFDFATSDSLLEELKSDNLLLKEDKLTTEEMAATISFLSTVVMLGLA